MKREAPHPLDLPVDPHAPKRDRWLTFRALALAESVSRRAARNFNSSRATRPYGASDLFDDIMQETLLRMVKASKSFDRRRVDPRGAPVPFAAYVSRFAQRCASKDAAKLQLPHGVHRTNEKRYHQLPQRLRLDTGVLVRHEDGEVEQLAAEAETQPWDLELSDEMRRTLSRLSWREREIIRLRVFADLTLAEVGRILGISRERVRQLEQRGLQRMRALLEVDKGTEKKLRALA